MLKNNNSKAVRHICIRAMKQNRTRNLFSVIAVVLTSFMFTSVFSIGFSLAKNMNTMFIRLNGSCDDIYLSCPSEEQIKQAESCKSLEHAGIRITAGAFEAADADNIWIDMNYHDDENFRYHITPALSDIKGKYPEKENEIMMSIAGLEALGINAPGTGTEIPVIIGDTRRNFVLTGYFRDYSFRKNNVYTAFVSEEFAGSTGRNTEEHGMLYMTAKAFSKNKLLEQLKENVTLSENQEFIFSSGSNEENGFSVAAIVLFICLIVLSSGYFLIYNIIYISVSRDIRFYGLLKTIGTTPKQVGRIVKTQAFILSAAGIPVGILLGTLTSFAAVPLSVDFLNTGVNSPEMPMEISFNPFIYAGTIIFTLITVALSCRKPAKIAGRVSPVEAVKYNGQNSAKIKPKKTTGGGKLYKMAFRNVFREKKRALLVFSSMLMGTFALLVTQSFFSSVKAENFAKRYYPDDYGIFTSYYSDIDAIGFGGTADENKVKAAEKLAEDIKSIDGITDVRLVRTATAELVFEKDTYMPFIENDAEKLNESAGYIISNLLQFAEDGKIKYDIIGIDRKMMERHNEKTKHKIDIDAFERGEICFMSGAMDEEQVTGCGNRTIALRNPENGNIKELRADFYAMYDDDYGFNYSGSYSFAYSYPGLPESIIVSQSVIDELTDMPRIHGIIADCEPDAEARVTAGIKRLTRNNCCIPADSCVEIKSEILKDFRSSMTSMNIITSGISIVLILIGVVNFINVMVTGVFTRRSELAVMESIGMTKKQIRKMLMLEGAYYAVISAGLILTAGSALVYAVSKWAADAVDYAVFSYPWQLTAAMTAAILVICVTVPVIVYSRISRESVTERLRTAV